MAGKITFKGNPLNLASPLDAGSLARHQFNNFNPPGGPVFFYHPLTPLDMSAFDALTLTDDAYKFFGGAIDIVGHEGLLPMFK